MTPPTFEHPAVTVGTVIAPLLGRASEAASDALGESTRYEHEAPVRVDAEGIFVDGKLACARDAIESVFVRLDRRWIVCVRHRPERLMMFKLSDPADAQRMLESFELPFARARTLFTVAPQLELANVRSPALVASFAAFVLVIGLAFHFSVPIAMGLLAGAGALVSLFWSTTRAEVGTDGVRVQWIWLSRYYAFSEIDEVAHDGEGTIVLTLRSKRRVSLRMSAPEHIALAVKRIEEGIAALKATPKAPEAPALRERVTDAVRVAELRRLGAAGQGDYRLAGLDREQLWAVVEDPANDAVARANAAAALSGRLDEAERQRLRVAASVTASPQVRVALETAAKAATDEELAEALSRVD